MPTYEYACDSCGHRFDVRQSFSDEPIRDCPACGASVRRVVYASGVIFKGSGWYVNDSRKSTTPAKASTTGSDSAGATAKSDKKEAAATDKSDKKEAVKTAADS